MSTLKKAWILASAILLAPSPAVALTVGDFFSRLTLDQRGNYVSNHIGNIVHRASINQDERTAQCVRNAFQLSADVSTDSSSEAMLDVVIKLDVANEIDPHGSEVEQVIEEVVAEKCGMPQQAAVHGPALTAN